MNVIDNYLEKIQVQQEIEPILIGAVIGAASLLNLSYQTYQNYFTRAARRCKDLPDKEKAICMLQSKLIAKQAELSKINSLTGKCKKPDCKEKLKNKVQNISLDLRNLKNRIIQLRKQKY